MATPGAGETTTELGVAATLTAAQAEHIIGVWRADDFVSPGAEKTLTEARSVSRRRKYTFKLQKTHMNILCANLVLAPQLAERRVGRPCRPATVVALSHDMYLSAPAEEDAPAEEASSAEDAPAEEASSAEEATSEYDRLRRACRDAGRRGGYIRVDKIGRFELPGGKTGEALLEHTKLWFEYFSAPQTPDADLQVRFVRLRNPRLPRRATQDTRDFLDALKRRDSRVVVVTERKLMPKVAEDIPQLEAFVNLSGTSYGTNSLLGTTRTWSININVKATFTRIGSMEKPKNPSRRRIIHIKVKGLSDGDEGFDGGRLRRAGEIILTLLRALRVHQIGVNCAQSVNRAPTFLCKHLLPAWFPDARRRTLATRQILKRGKSASPNGRHVSEAYVWYSMLQHVYWKSQQIAEGYPKVKSQRPGFCLVCNARITIWPGTETKNIWGAKKVDYLEGPMKLTVETLLGAWRALGWVDELEAGKGGNAGALHPTTLAGRTPRNTRKRAKTKRQ